MDIFVHKDGQNLGPFSESRIRAGIESGEFATNDVGWRDGLVDWLPLPQVIPPSPPAFRPPVPPPLPMRERGTNNSSRSNLKIAGIVFAVLLYPIVYVCGMFSGLTRAIAGAGAVSLKDDLVTQTVIVAGPSVSVYIHSISNPDPDQVVVDFKDRDSGKITSSETLRTETDSRGRPNFSFHLPGSADAVIHRP